MQKFVLYEKAREVNKRLHLLCSSSKKIDRFKKDQLRRASTSMVLNIAEGNARFTNKDRLHFFTIVRGSANECIALIDMLEDLQILNQEEGDRFRGGLSEIGKICSALIKRMMGTM